jgi:hypothetical protein
VGFSAKAVATRPVNPGALNVVIQAASGLVLAASGAAAKTGGTGGVSGVTAHPPKVATAIPNPKVNAAFFTIRSLVSDLSVQQLTVNNNLLFFNNNHPRANTGYRTARCRSLQYRMRWVDAGQFGVNL